MSAPPISASDPGRAEMRAALAAGWRRSDLWWERLQERGNVDWAAGDRRRASRLFLCAYWLALARMERCDPRFATSLANAALAARARGAEHRAHTRYARAIRLWSELPARLAAVEIKPRARSSLFHLRMEARHRDAYRANATTRLAAFLAESGRAIQAIARDEPAPVRLHSRWLGEKPAVFDGRRKVLAACLLIAPEA